MDTTPKMKAEAVLPEPVPPEDWECCGSECGDACVHMIYAREKQAYDAQQRLLQGQQAQEKDEK